ncbi:MAG: hypothetical protein PHV62_04165 [Sulfuricurvum sp.]|nr:hypothetical protein [Sulfuricurvum sp.]
MQVQTKSSSSSFNSYEIQNDPLQEQLKGDFITVASQLSSSEKRLYNSMMYTQNYEGAKEIINLGFMRATDLEKSDKPTRLLDIKA